MAEDSEATYEEIEQFVDIAESAKEIMVQTKWLGFPDECDFTWQKINPLFEYVPELFMNYL